MGAIGGTYIPLTRKAKVSEICDDYYNWHHSFSFLLQGVCNYNQQFLNVCVCVLGKCHNSIYLQMLSLWQNMKNDELPIKNKYKVGGANDIDVQPYLLDDSTYPLCLGLLKCYTIRGTGGLEQNKLDSKWRT